MKVDTPNDDLVAAVYSSLYTKQGHELGKQLAYLTQNRKPENEQSRQVGTVYIHVYDVSVQYILFRMLLLPDI